MRRLLSTSLMAIVLLGAAGAQAEPPEGKDWVNTFDQAFSRSAVDSEIWAAGRPSEAGEAGRLLVSDGALHLVARHRPHSRRWRTADLSTKHFHQTFGYFEARLRYARSTGLTNVFRLQTDQPVAAGGMQIAIDEGAYPNHVGISLRLHRRPVATVRLTMPDVDLSADYHLYGMEWLPDGHGSTRLTWFVDGRRVHSIQCSDCTRPMGLWLGTQVMTPEGPFSPVSDGAAMDVVSVRAYQLRALVK